MSKKPVALIILDGFGYSDKKEGNAIYKAKKPNIDKMFKNNVTTLIGASGMDVGLPNGQMGNSEVGHTNIGAGRIVYQDLTRITKSIEDGDFFKNKTLLNAIESAKSNNSSLHLMGLLSNGGVHSHNTHLYALLKMAKENNIENVYVHAFMDGRDVPPKSGIDFIKECDSMIEQIGVGEIATVAGRYYAMDRDNRWDRVKKAYDALVYREGELADNAALAIENSYKKGDTDEFVLPTICSNKGAIKENDSVIFFNFRPDRAREITRALIDKDFKGFERKNGELSLNFVCMTEYDATIKNVSVAFGGESLDNIFGEYISKLGLKQLRIAETEKYAHVTFFFNGGREKEFSGEDRALIKSPSVATYDLKPEMSAYEVTKEAIKRIEQDKYDVIILNYANCDMVGHTGVFSAAVEAVEAVDDCLGKLLDEIEKKGGVAIVTADHGNADKMIDEDGSPFTAHTTNPVTLTVVGYNCKLREGGKLADIAPTMLDIMNLEKPSEMTGISLIEK